MISGKDSSLSWRHRRSRSVQCLWTQSTLASTNESTSRKEWGSVKPWHTRFAIILFIRCERLWQKTFGMTDTSIPFYWHELSNGLARSQAKRTHLRQNFIDTTNEIKRTQTRSILVTSSREKQSHVKVYLAWSEREEYSTRRLVRDNYLRTVSLPLIACRRTISATFVLMKAKEIEKNMDEFARSNLSHASNNPCLRRSPTAMK